jgi:EmrB/QacA subfamily drug resistance transporter
MLVIFRGIQALGAAMLSANSPAILTKSFPASQRGQALGLQATMTYLGLTVGPPLGGWLAHQFSWRAVFYINIPVGLVAFLASLHFIAADHPENKKERFDIPGAGLFTAGLVALLLALNQGHVLGWFSAPILILILISLVFLAGFIITELRSPYPMLDLTLFKDRVFSTAVGSAVLNYICVYSLIFLLPFYLIEGRGWDTAVAGKILMAQPVVMMIVAPISGTLSDRVGTRWPAMLGMAGLSGGLFLLSRLDSTSTILTIALSLGISGLGTGIFISPNNSALMGSAPHHRQGIAAGILATARNMGMVLGVGLAGAIFNTRYPPGSPLSDLFPAFQISFLVVTFVGLFGLLITAIRPQKAAT